ncbi:MAG: hypothetical protein EB078_06260, partial [Proteobacteria bacterium]|nr:hypothetical protein [Pseudomonadota bacterium]
MKHLIIGAGNLGKDLLCELTKEHETLLLSQSNGDNVKDLSIINKIEAFYPNCVWVAIGGGSVQECKPTSPTYKDAKYINQDFPAFLNCCLPKSTKVV